ncbi:Uncharacterised protein [Mycobacteroides abscessus subsp. massiliense]|nr:Uncharacterised protein [Mycobacteroides abscessus subsp. massiliense]
MSGRNDAFVRSWTVSTGLGCPVVELSTGLGCPVVEFSTGLGCPVVTSAMPGKVRLYSAALPAFEFAAEVCSISPSARPVASARRTVRTFTSAALDRFSSPGCAPVPSR